MDEIGAVATVERAMGVKRALNAHDERREGVDISQMSTSGWKYVHIKYSCKIYPYIPPPVRIGR